MTTPNTSSASIIKPKVIARASKEKGSAAAKTSTKSKTTEKKPFKIVIRKLPVRDFNIDDFRSSLSRVLSKLGYPAIVDGTSGSTVREEVQIEHFIEGKLSRKRGPVSGAGFICIKDEEIFRKFLAQCPSQIPFLEADDINNQPEIEMAPNQRVTRVVEKIDKYEGTFLNDPDYKNLLIRMAQPEVKRPSAEIQYENKIEEVAIDYKNLPMIKYLREKGEKKIAEKKFLRRSQAAAGISGSSSSGKGSRGGSRGGSEKERGGDRGSGKGSAASSGSLKRTTMAATSITSRQSTHAEEGSTHSTGSNNSKGNKGSKGSSSNRSGTSSGAGESGLIKMPVAAVGRPVDADMQEAIRRSVISFREESTAVVSSSTRTHNTIAGADIDTVAGAVKDSNSSAGGTSGAGTENSKMSRREREREKAKKRIAANPDPQSARATDGSTSSSSNKANDGRGQDRGKDPGFDQGKEGVRHGGLDGNLKNTEEERNQGAGENVKGSGSRWRKGSKGQQPVGSNDIPSPGGAAATPTVKEEGKHRNRGGGGKGGDKVQGQGQGQDNASTPKPMKIMKRADATGPSTV